MYWLYILLAKYALKIIFFQSAFNIGIENMSDGTFLTNVGRNLISIMYTVKKHILWTSVEVLL